MKLSEVNLKIKIMYPWFQGNKTVLGPTGPPANVPFYNEFCGDNGNDNTNGSRKRKYNDIDYDICWDFVSPKGCQRDNCQWRHEQRMYVDIYLRLGYHIFLI